MPSSSSTSTHSSDMADDKKASAAVAADATITQRPSKSFSRRATTKLRSFFCLPNEPQLSLPSTDEPAKDKKDKDQKPEDQTMKTEFKHLDRKFDDEDQPYFVERKKEEIEKGEKKDWWQLFAFCVVRRYDSDGDLDETYLYVNPQPL
jgi:hypothetical protein